MKSLLTVIIFTLLLNYANAQSNQEHLDMEIYKKAFSFIQNAPKIVKDKKSEFSNSGIDTISFIVSRELIPMELLMFDKEDLVQIPHFKGVPNLKTFIYYYDQVLFKTFIPGFTDHLSSLNRLKKADYILFFSRYQNNMLQADLCAYRNSRSYDITTMFATIDRFLFVFDKNRNITQILHIVLCIN